MDPLTQSLLGAAAAQFGTSHKLGRWAGAVGLIGGGLADLDVVLRPLSDPALPWQYHRHFTHALTFIPVGALLAMLPFLAVRRLRREWRWLYLAALLAYATHGLLDACTAFGTLLFWPVSDALVAWDCVGIVDPVFTGILIAAVLAAARRRSGKLAAVGLVLAVLYLGVGAVQHQRALAMQGQVAAARGHAIDRGRVMPTPANLVLWRSIYGVDGVLHADFLRVPFLGEPGLQPGDSAPVWRVEELPSGFVDPERAHTVMEYFEYFSDGYVALQPDAPGFVGDMRYSTKAGFAPLWGIELAPGSEDEVRWRTSFGDRAGAPNELIEAVLRGEGFQPVPE